MNLRSANIFKLDGSLRGRFFLMKSTSLSKYLVSVYGDENLAGFFLEVHHVVAMTVCVQKTPFVLQFCGKMDTMCKTSLTALQKKESVGQSSFTASCCQLLPALPA